MRHILFDSHTYNLEVAILIKDSGFNKVKLNNNYIKPTAVPEEKFVAFNLEYDKPKTVTAKHAKDYLTELLPAINDLNITVLLVCDSNYFKYLTKNQKTDPFFGYVCPCAIDGYEHMNVILAPNFQALIYNPTLQSKMDLSLNALKQHLAGTYHEPGTNVIHYEAYPKTTTEIAGWLNKLHQYDQLTCDIEGLDLVFYKCGISTITFTWNKHEGIAFAVDRGDCSETIRFYLRIFFESYRVN